MNARTPLLVVLCLVLSAVVPVSVVASPGTPSAPHTSASIASDTGAAGGSLQATGTGTDGPSAAADPQENRTTVHVVLARDADVDAVAAAVADHGTVLDRSTETAVLVVRTADLDAVRGVEGVLRIESTTALDVGTPTTSPASLETTDDGSFWSRAIGAPSGRDLVSANDSVDVAVVDTGVEHTRSEFDDTLVWGAETVGAETTYGLEAGAPDGDHGTTVAGYVGAEGDLGSFTGVAPNADLYSVRVFEDGTGNVSDLVDALYVAKRGPDRTRGTADDADVITLSLSAASGSTMLERAVENLTTDTVLVAAAGNAGDGDPSTDEVAYPARYPGTIAVGATNHDNETASFSSTGPAIDVAAPGRNIEGIDSGVLHSGTSFAAPQVAGAAALLVAERGPLSTAEAREFLAAGARDVDAPGPDDASGAGLLQVDAALRAAGAESDGGTGDDGDDGGTDPAPDVTLSAAATNATAAAGGRATVTYEVRNGGADPATDLRLHLDALPDWWRIEAFDGNGSAVTWAPDGRTWRWADPLPPNGTRTLALTLSVPADAAPGDYALPATVAASGDGAGAASVVTVEAAGDDGGDEVDRSPTPLAVTATNATVAPGGEVALTANVTNGGADALAAPRLSLEALPANWSVREQSSTGTYVGRDRSWFWLSAVGPGERRTATVAVAVPEGAANGTMRLRWVAESDAATNATASVVTVREGDDDPLAHVDRNGNGIIEAAEVQAAIVAFNRGATIGGEPVTGADVQAAIVAFNG